MARFNPAQPRNRVGEWTNGAPAVSSHFAPAASHPAAPRAASPSPRRAAAPHAAALKSSPRAQARPAPATSRPAAAPPPAALRKPAARPAKPAAAAKAPAPVKNPQQFIQSHYAGWKKDMTPAQDKAMSFYQSPGFALMNGQLRGTSADELKRGEHASDSDLARARKASADLAKAIRKAPPLDSDTTVYRAFSADQFGSLKPGQVVTDKGFTSTSLANDVSMVGRGGSQAKAEIVLPKGTRAGAGSARELVLPPGGQFKVLSASGKNVKLQYIPPGGK